MARITLQCIPDANVVSAQHDWTRAQLVAWLLAVQDGPGGPAAITISCDLAAAKELGLSRDADGSWCLYDGEYDLAAVVNVIDAASTANAATVTAPAPTSLKWDEYWQAHPDGNIWRFSAVAIGEVLVWRPEGSMPDGTYQTKTLFLSKLAEHGIAKTRDAAVRALWRPRR